jgi:hypothetical protein
MLPACGAGGPNAQIGQYLGQEEQRLVVSRENTKSQGKFPKAGRVFVSAPEWTKTNTQQRALFCSASALCRYFGGDAYIISAADNRTLGWCSSDRRIILLRPSEEECGPAGCP